MRLKLFLLVCLACLLTSSISYCYASTEISTYSYDLDNKLTSITPSGDTNGDTQTTLNYDNNGNLTSDSQGHQYGYNLENEMVKYTYENTEVATYNYYPNSMRASKTILGSNNGDGKTVRFYYNGDKYAQIVNEETENNDYTSYAMLGSNRYVRIVHQLNSNTTPITKQYLIKNNKNIIAKLDSTGNIDSSYAYDPYGKEVNLGKANKVKENIEYSLIANPFGYESEYKDSESDLIYLRARYYSPQLMRFISRDTADLPNRYEYADGNPISNVDPSGHSIEDDLKIGASIVGIIGGAIAIAALPEAAPEVPALEESLEASMTSSVNETVTASTVAKLDKPVSDLEVISQANKSTTDTNIPEDLKTVNQPEFTPAEIHKKMNEIHHIGNINKDTYMGKELNNDAVVGYDHTKKISQKITLSEIDASNRKFYAINSFSTLKKTDHSLEFKMITHNLSRKEINHVVKVNYVPAGDMSLISDVDTSEINTYDKNLHTSMRIMINQFVKFK